MKQHRMTTPGPLLNERGELAEKGYATGLIKRYDRGAVRASPLRIKEWDYYLIASDAYALALTIADNGYLGLDSVSLIDLGERWEQTTSRMSLLPLRRRGLPRADHLCQRPGRSLCRGSGAACRRRRAGRP